MSNRTWIIIGVAAVAAWYLWRKNANATPPASVPVSASGASVPPSAGNTGTPGANAMVAAAAS